MSTSKVQIHLHYALKHSCSLLFLCLVLAMCSGGPVSAEEPHGVGSDSSMTEECPKKSMWRDSTCGYWIYSGSESVPKGYRTIELSGIDMLPFPTNFNPEDPCNREPVNVLGMYVYSDIIFLASDEIVSSTEIGSFLNILYSLYCGNEFGPASSRPRPKPIEGCHQFARIEACFYDEAIQEHTHSYPRTSIRDIYIDTEYILVNYMMEE